MIDDGITRIVETLDPDGRVLARTVTDSVTGEVLEQVTVGYAGPGDNRAYEIAGTSVVTYIAGPDGLLTIDTAGVAVWPLDDGHGHTLGTADSNGTYTRNPVADEFGNMPEGTQARGQDSLDWLGGEMRHRTGDHFGLIRMGVRLYDPGLGRFLGVDPVDGGSANAYEYCNADPINCRDLDGRWSLKKVLVAAAKVAQFIPGPIGTVANAGWGVYYASTGQYGKAAISLASAASFGVARYTSVVGRVAQRSSLIGKSSRLFGRNKVGIFNRNDVARVGWSWKGSARGGANVFRAVIGSQRNRFGIHMHYTMMRGVS